MVLLLLLAVVLVLAGVAAGRYGGVTGWLLVVAVAVVVGVSLLADGAVDPTDVAVSLVLVLLAATGVAVGLRLGRRRTALQPIRGARVEIVEGRRH